MSRVYQEQWEHYTLPYGMYTCLDGKEILYNRSYQGIWQRANGVVTRCNQAEYFKNINQTKQTHFSKLSNKKKREILEEWGVGQPDYAQWAKLYRASKDNSVWRYSIWRSIYSEEFSIKAMKDNPKELVTLMNIPCY